MRRTSVRKQSNPAYRLALCSLMAALSVAMMLASSLIPILTYASPLAAGVMLIPVICEFGTGYAWMTWSVTAVLGLLLCADREAAFFYLLLGYYPVLKPGLDRIPVRALRVMGKLALFAAAMTAEFMILAFVLGLEDMRTELLLNLAVYAMLVGIMMIYDRTLDRLLLVYRYRLRPKLLRRQGR